MLFLSCPKVKFSLSIKSVHDIPVYRYTYEKIMFMVIQATVDRSVTGKGAITLLFFRVDPLLVSCLYVWWFLYEMCCIPAIDFFLKCDKLKYSWKWKEDMSMGMCCIPVAGVIYIFLLAYPGWCPAEYIRIAKYEKVLILSFIKCWSHVLIVGFVTDSAESCWLT